MIIINEKKLIKDPSQMEVLNHLKHRSNNEYCVRNVANSIITDGDLFISYCFRIDNIVYCETFYNKASSDCFNIDETERHVINVRNIF